MILLISLIMLCFFSHSASGHQLPPSSILSSQATTSSYRSRSPVSSSFQFSSSSSSQQSSAASHSQSSSVVMESSQDSDLIVPPDPLFIFQPGEFEVVLCVDNCETAGGWVPWLSSLHLKWPISSQPRRPAVAERHEGQIALLSAGTELD